MDGMSVLPIAAVSVTAAPVSPAKRRQVVTLTCESAPGTRPKSEPAKAMSRSVSPARFITSAVMMK
jgi:hypothetical protein